MSLLNHEEITGHNLSFVTSFKHEAQAAAALNHNLSADLFVQREKSAYIVVGLWTVVGSTR